MPCSALAASCRVLVLVLGHTQWLLDGAEQVQGLGGIEQLQPLMRVLTARPLNALHIRCKQRGLEITPTLLKCAKKIDFWW
jgi:hypothetical protein